MRDFFQLPYETRYPLHFGAGNVGCGHLYARRGANFISITSSWCTDVHALDVICSAVVPGTFALAFVSPSTVKLVPSTYHEHRWLHRSLVPTGWRTRQQGLRQVYGSRRLSI